MRPTLQVPSNRFSPKPSSLFKVTILMVVIHFLKRWPLSRQPKHLVQWGGRCATLAAQVKHTAFYLEVVVESITNVDYPKADWGEIWRNTQAVDAEEWGAIQAELRLRYDNTLNLIDNTPAWPSQAHLAGAMALVAHSAYHLGEIRQALCMLKPA